MGIIRKSLWVIGNRGKLKLDALFDTGSTHSLVRDDLVDRLGNRDEWPEPKTFHAAIGTFTARELVIADICIGKHRPSAVLTPVTNLSEEIILGTDFLQRWHIKLDPFRRRVILDPAEMRFRA